MKSHPSIKHTFVLLAALILCGLTSQAHTTQDSASRWTLHLQAGFGENCAEALSWDGSDALLWTGQIGLRYSLSPRFSVGASIGMHDQFLTSRPHRWCFMPVVADYHGRRFYVEGGITGGYVNSWDNSQDLSLYQIGIVAGCGLIFHTGERSCVRIGLQQSFVGEKHRLYRYEDESSPMVYDHDTWWADSDFQLTLAYLLRL